MRQECIKSIHGSSRFEKYVFQNQNSKKRVSERLGNKNRIIETKVR